MMDVLSEYWIYIVVAIVLIALSFVLLGGGKKRNLDIGGDTASGLRPTLRKMGDLQIDKYGVPRDEKGRPPMFMPVPKPDKPRQNLCMIKGLAIEHASRLDAVNIHRWEQIARWTEIEQAGVADLLCIDVEKIKNDRWMEQAALLAADKIEEYEATFGKIPEKELERSKSSAFSA